jgi:heme/copper-type cytochrome/quinol oxidase subunit 3
MNVAEVKTAPSKALSTTATGSRALGWWGMALFILTEAALFLTLIFSYFYIQMGTPTWPPEGIKPPDLRLPIIMTVILLSSSAPVFWAESGIRKGSQGRLRWGLALAFLLGAVFLGLQGYEYSNKEFSPQTNAYGSLFFIITGLHGTHLLAGMALNGVTQAQAWLSHFDERRHLAVQNTAMY